MCRVLYFDFDESIWIAFQAKYLLFEANKVKYFLRIQYADCNYFLWAIFRNLSTIITSILPQKLQTLSTIFPFFCSAQALGLSSAFVLFLKFWHLQTNVKNKSWQIIKDSFPTLETEVPEGRPCSFLYDHLAYCCTSSLTRMPSNAKPPGSGCQISIIRTRKAMKYLQSISTLSGFKKSWF